MLLAPPAAPAVPSAVTTSPYRLATPHGPRDWQGRAPAHTLPPPDWVPARDCASGPASLPFVRRGRVRTSRSPAWLGPAPAEPPRPSPSHGAGAAVASSSPSRPPRPPVCTPAGRWERDTKRSAPAVGRRCLTPGRAGPKPAPPSVPPRSARPSTASSTGRGARAWPGAAGTEARRGPPRPDRGPLLPRSGSGGQGWASPRGRLGAALPRLSLDCGEE